MRRALIAVLALMLAASMQGASRAQDVRLHRAGEMRGIDGRVLGALRSLPAEKDAQEILRLVLSAGGFAGMEDRIILRASQDVANAIATIERNERYIIYNSKFMQDIVNRTQNYWSRVAILAHEVGHHLRLHTIIPGNDHKFELEADYQAGFIAGRMGATLAEAQAVFRTFDRDPTPSHPGRAARLDQVRLGWDAARPTAGHALKAGVMFGNKLSVDFSAGSRGEGPRHLVAAQPYLRQGPVAISVDDRHPPGSGLVLVNNRGLYEGRAVEPSVSENFLTQIDTGNVPATFTLRFSQPLKSFSFVLPKLWPATASGITFPAWRASALSADGQIVASASDGLVAGPRGYADVASRTITLQAPATTSIVATRFESDPTSGGRPFAAFSTVLIEQIILETK